MARQPTTRLHVSGHRFLLRRTEHAFLRRDIRMLDDPMRSEVRSLGAGLALAVVAVLVCAAVAFIRPQDSLGDAPIAMVRNTGALYVRVGDLVHPVLNLTSARLVTGSAAMPRPIAATELRHTRRGPLIGIPGAPGQIGDPLTADESAWAVCDDGDSVTVVAGPQPKSTGTRRVSGRVTMLVRAPVGDMYLLYDGKRALVDLSDLPTMRALRLDGVAPRDVAVEVLNAIPEAPPIAAPAVVGAGSAGPTSLAGWRVGTVLRIDRADGAEHYVVLRDGVQRVGRVTADLVRFADSHGARDVVPVAADAVSATRAVDELPVDGFPDAVDPPIDAGVVCSVWPSDGSTPSTTLGDSVPMPADVSLGRAGTRVYVPPGRSLFVSTPDLFVVGDTGVRYRIPDAATAAVVGISTKPVAASWSIVRLVPEGPELSRQAASFAHDIFGSSPPPP